MSTLNTPKYSKYKIKKVGSRTTGSPSDPSQSENACILTFVM